MTEVVAFFMLPRYYDGEMVTAYANLGKRSGASTQTTAGVTFLLTRLLADDIRVIAAAIPLKVMLDGLGIDVSYFVIPVILSVVTILYSFIGGITAVVWVDVVQMVLYVTGGVLAIILITSHIGMDWLGEVAAASKTQLLVVAGNPLTPGPQRPSERAPTVSALGGAESDSPGSFALMTNEASLRQRQCALS